LGEVKTVPDQDQWTNHMWHMEDATAAEEWNDVE